MSVGDNGGTTPPKKLGGVTGKGFKPGQSGNPAGGPKKPAELTVRCQGMTAAVLDRLAEIIKSGEDRDAIPAGKLILSYGWGNPSQPVTGEDGGPLMFANVDLSKLSDAQLAALTALRAASKAASK